MSTADWIVGIFALDMLITLVIFLVLGIFWDRL